MELNTRLAKALQKVYECFVGHTDLSGEQPDEPVQSNLEALLYALAGMQVEQVAPETELENILAKFAQNRSEISGGSGGGGGK